MFSSKAGASPAGAKGLMLTAVVTVNKQFREAILLSDTQRFAGVGNN